MKKIINFGCIGFGFMGKTHVSNILKHPYANLKAIYSHPDLPIDKKDSKDLGDCSLYTDNWKELVDREDIDAIIIATPTHTHAEIAQYVAQMKKHIFVEKPMARTLEGANIIMESARKNNVKLFVGHVLRFFQSFSQAKQSLNQKTTDIGQVKMIRGLRYSTLPNWSSWFFNEKKSGGCILDLSIHDIDYAIWMMGKMPSEVFCKARKLPEQNVNTWVVSMTTLDFGGALAHLEASWLGASTFQWLTDHEIIGTEGIIRFNSDEGIPLHVYSEEEHLPLDTFEHDGYYYELDSFIQSLLMGKPVKVSGGDGRDAIAVCLAAIKSAEENRIVKMEEIL